MMVFDCQANVANIDLDESALTFWVFVTGPEDRILNFDVSILICL